MESVWKAATASPGDGLKPGTLKTSEFTTDSERPLTAANPSIAMVRRGRRFESVRGLCKSAAPRRVLVQVDLLPSNVRWVWSGLWSLKVENAR
jgi:hypothetical protein